MSEQNVELVRSVLSAWEGKDAVAYIAELERDLEATRARLESVYTPDVEVSWSEKNVERSYRGHDGLLTAFGEWLDSFAEFYVEVLDFIDAGDQVVVPQIQRGKGRASGAWAEQRLVHVFTIEEGKVARLAEFDTLEEAMASVGADAPEVGRASA